MSFKIKIITSVVAIVAIVASIVSIYMYINHINNTVLNKIAFTASKKLGGKDSKSLPGVATENFAEGINLVDIMSEQG